MRHAIDYLKHDSGFQHELICMSAVVTWSHDVHKLLHLHCTTNAHDKRIIHQPNTTQPFMPVPSIAMSRFNESEFLLVFLLFWHDFKFDLNLTYSWYSCFCIEREEEELIICLVSNVDDLNYRERDINSCNPGGDEWMYDLSMTKYEIIYWTKFPFVKIEK